MSKFSAQIKGRNFKTLVDSVKLISKEVRLLVDEDGFEITCIDDANVCMLNIRLHKEAFYQFDIKESCELGVSIEELSKFIEDGLLTLDCSSNSVLTLTQGKYKFNIRLLDVDTIRRIKMPSQFTSSVEFDIPGERLKEVINICKKIDNDIVFKASKDQVKIECSSNLVKMDTEITDKEISNYQYTEDANTMFDIDYIIILRDIIPSTPIHMTLKTSYPSKINAKFANDTGDINILLAPKVEM